MIRDIETTDINKILDCITLYEQSARLEGSNKINKDFLINNLRQGIISANHKIVVKEMMQKIVGFAVGTLLQNHWNNQMYGEISYIFVHPDLEGRSHKKELFDELNTWFMDEGCHYSLCMTHHWNEQYQPQSEYIEDSDKFYTHNDCVMVGHNYIKVLR
jgi:N-acetylglutamate synthase-like GNAT family acetyltransferase